MRVAPSDPLGCLPTVLDTGDTTRGERWTPRRDGRWYLSSVPPARPAWHANLRADPRFTVHVEHGAHADLAAVAVPVTDPAEKRRVLQHVADDLEQA